MAFNQRLGVRDTIVDPTTRSGEQDLFRTLYLTEVVKAFQENNIMSGLTQSRSIANGKSATFPTFWKTTAHYHLPSDVDLDGTDRVRHDERVIAVDRVLMSDIKVAEIDELHNHYDVRAMYAEQQGNALAQAYDKQLIGMALNATQTGYDRLPGDSGETNKPNWNGVAREVAGIDATAAGLIQGIYDALQLMEENDVPTQGLVLIMRPQNYYFLLTAGDGTGTIAINRDYGGDGGIASGMLPMIAGIPVLKSNNFPYTDLSDVNGNTVNGTVLKETNGGALAFASGVPDEQQAGSGAKYIGDYSKVAGLLLHPTCLATVKLMDLKYESEYLIQKQSTLMVAKMAVGHGCLRDEAAVVLKTTAVQA